MDSQRRRHLGSWVGRAAIVALVAIAAEVLSYLTLRLDIGALERRVYWPPSITPEEIADYLERRDPLLGWPDRNWLANNADAEGARRSPANQRLRDRPVCVSTYGDSFTFGTEVEDESAWTNVLADTLGCPVSNFGVAGYGVDQAILRFERNAEDRADLVVLGFYMLDMDRSMAQWFYTISPSTKTKFSFKPRFLLEENGELRLVPLPVDSYDTARKLIRRPASVLTADAYVPDGPSLQSKVAASFPFSWAVIRLARKVVASLDRSRISLSRNIKEWNYPEWFDTKDGPWPGKVELNARLMRRFAELCATRGQRCVVLVLPDADEIESRRLSEPQPVEQVLGPIAEQIEMWDPTGYFAEQSGERGPCRFFGADRACYGHYNSEGSAVLARFMALRIAADKRAPPPA